MRISVLPIIICFVLLSTSCREDERIIPSTPNQVTPGVNGTSVKGFFLLNEGNMGSNKCTLDFYDSTTGKYHRNIYAERNPSVVKELGDVGNDLQIYGDKLYAVINCSNFIEVMDVETAQHLGQINVTNCRYITFNDGKAYVSSYAGPVGIDPNARPGKVVEVDTTSLAVTREVVVGYQPEEMVIQDGKLYVWGGFAPAVEGHQASLSVDGYMYSPETKEWSSVATPYDAEGNEISLGGGMGTSFGEGMILCAGGVDKDIFLKALQGIYAGKEYLSHPVEWYRFNRNLLLYHPQTDKWTTLGEYEQGARAGAVIVSQDGFHYIINGELKPGIRTNEINRIKEKRR